MANEALTNIALLYSMAAISGSGGGDTPIPRGSVSVTVGTVYTVGPNEQAKVINIGNEQNVVLDFYIPQGVAGQGSQWYISDAIPGTLVEGAVDGDLILYTTGEVYKVVDGKAVDQGLTIGGTNNSPYDYAVKAGFKGSEAKFQELWLASLNSGFTNTILDGGKSDSQVHTVQNDAGLSSTTKYDILVSGDNELDE